MRIKTDKESLVRYLLIVAIILVSGAAFVLYFTKVMPELGAILRFIGILITPFAVAWLAAVITAPLTDALIHKLHFPPSLAVLLVILIFFAVIGALIFLFVSVLVDVLGSMAQYIIDLNDMEGNLMDVVTDLYSRLGLDSQQVLAVLDQFKDKIIQFASGGFGVLVDIAKATPGAFVLVFVTLVAVFYWCRDEKKIIPVLCKAFPRKWRDNAGNTYYSFSSVIGKYIRAQLILISISFVLCLAGFFILGVDSAVAMALFTAVLDIIPVLGPGTLLVPWGVVAICLGDVRLGIGLIILFVVVSVVRNILQPKVVGDSIGLHPLAALAAIFVGMKAFGIMGLILGPVLLAVAMGAYRSYKQHRAETLPEKGAQEENSEVSGDNQ